jgi:fumarate hydratase class II
MNVLSALKVLIGADSSELNAKLAESQERVSEWAEKIGSIMEGITFAGIGFGAAAAADKFEEAAARIQRATGATGEKLETLKDSFANVYANTDVSAEQVQARSI